jgi:hypothetical protein
MATKVAVLENQLRAIVIDTKLILATSKKKKCSREFKAKLGITVTDSKVVLSFRAH